MLRALFAAIVVATSAGCTRPPVREVFAQCRLEALKVVGADRNDGPYISDCMEARGYEIKNGYCSTIAAPETLEHCYRTMRHP